MYINNKARSPRENCSLIACVGKQFSSKSMPMPVKVIDINSPFAPINFLISTNFSPSLSVFMKDVRDSNATASRELFAFRALFPRWQCAPIKLSLAAPYFLVFIICVHKNYLIFHRPQEGWETQLLLWRWQYGIIIKSLPRSYSIIYPLLPVQEPLFWRWKSCRVQKKIICAKLTWKWRA